MLSLCDLKTECSEGLVEALVYCFLFFLLCSVEINSDTSPVFSSSANSKMLSRWCSEVAWSIKAFGHFFQLRNPVSINFNC